MPTYGSSLPKGRGDCAVRAVTAAVDCRSAGSVRRSTPRTDCRYRLEGIGSPAVTYVGRFVPRQWIVDMSATDKLFKNFRSLAGENVIEYGYGYNEDVSITILAGDTGFSTTAACGTWTRKGDSVSTVR